MYNKSNILNAPSYKCREIFLSTSLLRYFRTQSTCRSNKEFERACFTNYSKNVSKNPSLWCQLTLFPEGELREFHFVSLLSFSPSLTYMRIDLFLSIQERLTAYFHFRIYSQTLGSVVFHSWSFWSDIQERQRVWGSHDFDRDVYINHHYGVLVLYTILYCFS